MTHQRGKIKFSYGADRRRRRLLNLFYPRNYYMPWVYFCRLSAILNFLGFFSHDDAQFYFLSYQSICCMLLLFFCNVIVILDKVTYYTFSSPECESEKVGQSDSDSDESDEDTEYQACCCMYISHNCCWRVIWESKGNSN